MPHDSLVTEHTNLRSRLRYFSLNIFLVTFWRVKESIIVQATHGGSKSREPLYSFWEDSSTVYQSQFLHKLRTVLRWAKTFDSRESCLKDGTRSGKPKTSLTNNEAAKAVVEEDARFWWKEIACCSTISEFTSFWKTTWVIEKNVQGGYHIWSQRIKNCNVYIVTINSVGAKTKNVSLFVKRTVSSKKYCM